MYNSQQIEDFIELMRNAIPNSVEVFTEGNCGQFALILSNVFKGGEILHNYSHAVYHYEGFYYDINGQLEHTKKEYKDMFPVKDLPTYEAQMLLKGRYEVPKPDSPWHFSVENHDRKVDFELEFTHKGEIKVIEKE